MKNRERQLFNHVEGIGETLNGEIHIIDMTDKPAVEGEQKFRVYHEKGYCFDISKECVDERKNGKLIYDYVFLAEWEGFNKLDVNEAIKLVLHLK